MLNRLFPKLHVEAERPVLWLHCASVGEFNTVKPILSELKRDFFILLTYFSPRAKDFLQKQGDFYHALHPLPLDIPCSMDRFLKQVKPSTLLVMERELWYFLIKRTKAKKILINAYAKGSIMEKVLSREFDLIICRTERDRDVFKSFGARAVACGNLKLVMEREEKEVALETPEGKTIVAGSFHPEELSFLKELYKALLEKFKDINLIVAPRHLSKVGLFLKEFSHFKPCLKGSKTSDCRVVVVDTLGELFYLYKLADLSLVGGTFAEGIGGHNILEPVYHKKLTLFGPYTHKIKDLEDFVLSKGLGFKVKNLSEAIDIATKIISGEISYPQFDLRELAEQIKNCYLSQILKVLNT